MLPNVAVAEKIADLIRLDYVNESELTSDIAILVYHYNPDITSPDLASNLIDVLKGRGGFDGWWDQIDKETQDDILDELDELIMSSVVGANMNAYQEIAHDTSLNTAIGGDTLIYAVLGLCNETGEFSGKLKKIHRDKGGVISDEDRDALKDELGDVLWYVAETATQLGLSLAEVAKHNNEKTQSRKKRGVISGNGDNR